METKICPGCKQELPFHSFHKNPKTKNGIHCYCKSCHKEKYGGDYQRNLDLKRKYGITLETYNILLKQQDYKCAICGQEESHSLFGNKVIPLSVDHNHETGEIRQLLCHACNTAIGLLGEDVSRLASAITYLEKHRKA